MDIKVKGIAISENIENAKNEIFIFNLNIPLKILAKSFLHLKKNLWLLNFTVDVYICNDRNLFKIFEKTSTSLSGVKSKEVFSC